MGKIAFVYSGQGDQYPGMGKVLAEKSPAAAQIFSRCDRLRPGTSRQCFYGTQEELRQTQNTQPCLYALELAITAALQGRNIFPEAVAGFSLGEVSAAAVSGMFDLESGFRLVCKRAELMQAASQKFDTSMAAVLRLTPAQVQAACSRFSAVYPVNYNCPGQISVSGLRSQMDAFSAAVREMGGRVLPLNVSGAFHSPFMSDAAARFAEELEHVRMSERTIPLYSNLTAQLYGENGADLLSRQICNPVRWEALIRNMIADGADVFIEIGPGKTLTNMIRKIDSSVTAKTSSELLEVTA